MTLYYVTMQVETVPFTKNNCEFYSRTITPGWIEIVKMDKEDANTFPEKKKHRKEMSFRYRCHSGDRMC